MKSYELVSALIANGIPPLQINKIVEVWPKWDEEDFIELKFVGPRPTRPPYRPDQIQHDNEQNENS